MRSSSACRRETSVSHAQALAEALEIEDALLLAVAAVDEERAAAALGLDALAQLRRRRAVGLQG
jgi:hypothetical protein